MRPPNETATPNNSNENASPNNPQANSSFASSRSKPEGRGLPQGAGPLTRLAPLTPGRPFAVTDQPAATIRKKKNETPTATAPNRSAHEQQCAHRKSAILTGQFDRISLPTRSREQRRFERMFTHRKRYKQGCLVREVRKQAPAVWVFRWRDETPNGKINRKIVIASVEELRTKSEALKAVEALRISINQDRWQPRTVEQLVCHYIEKELSDETTTKSHSTKQAYRSYITNRILPIWGLRRISEVKTVAIEDWLHNLPLSNGSKAKIRNIMHLLFNHAIRNEWADRNPITLVRQSAKRERTPDVLQVGEIHSLLQELGEPCRTMVFLAACTGLRVSELIGLKWCDIDFDSLQMNLSRSVVCQVVGKMKTEVSHKPLPLDPNIATALLKWRALTLFNEPGDWIFASPSTNGQKPYWPEMVLRRHIRPAAKRAGIQKKIGWHTFRRTYATLLKANGEDVKVTQELMRHASSLITLDIYAQAMTPAKREAQRRVVEMIQRGRKPELFPSVPTTGNDQFASY